MAKRYLIALTAATVLLANDKISIYSQQIEGLDDKIETDSNPIVLYQDKILTADKITYDKNSSTIEAFGSVKIFENDKHFALSEYAKIENERDYKYLKPFYMTNFQDGSWLSASEATACENEIDLKSGMVSGCSSDDPAWKMRFSSGDYDTQKMWVNLYNVRLEIGDMPIFYLPYFGYPTDTTRRSGLLFPIIGVSSSEGFYYQQPIYFAPHNWWDAELKPQIRTSRGHGLYSDFRFIDTPSSDGFVRVGYFKEKISYLDKEDLKNQKHFGYTLRYSHTSPLREWFGIDSGESGLYLDGEWMNDVEYLNLQNSDETQNSTTSQILSRINGYYSGNDNYIGAYFKHYQYLDKASNSETLQTLPSLHYHRYLESFFDDILYVSGDAMINHYYRPHGKRAIEADINIPATFQTSIFDEYLDVSYSAVLSSKAIGFYATDRDIEKDQYKNGKYAQLDHIFSIGSSLVKGYSDGYSHVMNPNISYIKSGGRHYGGYYEKYKNRCDSVTDVACDFYTIDNPTDQLSIGLNNYLFQNGSSVIVDRLSQNFSFDDSTTQKGELVNELEWHINSSLYFYNQTAFDHDRKRITKEQNSLRYSGDSITASAGHYYSDELVDYKPKYSSYLTGDFSYRYDKNYKLFGSVAYDYSDSVMKKGELGILYSQRCLDIGIRYIENRRPTLTNDFASNYKDDRYIFISVVLKPLGGYDFNYKLSGN